MMLKCSEMTDALTARTVLSAHVKLAPFLSQEKACGTSFSLTTEVSLPLVEPLNLESNPCEWYMK